MHGLAWSAHAHWLLGHDDLALSSSHDAVRMARSIDHPYSLAVALAYAAITHQLRGDRPALRGAVTELAELCDRFDFSYYREWALVLDGWGSGGEPGITLARRGIDNLRAEGSFARMPYWLSLLADVLDRTGQRDAARSTLDAATASAQAHQRRVVAPRGAADARRPRRAPSRRPSPGSARRPTWRPGTAALHCCAAANATSLSAAFARRSPPFARRP